MGAAEGYRSIGVNARDGEGADLDGIELGSVGQSDLSIQSQSHIEPHSRERSSAHRYRDIDIHTVE